MVGFRADIEGLRGIAIAMVVLAHAGIPGLGGGFIGVDVFFVISGFLITSILTRELASRGAIDYWRFYAHRAKRLVPALGLMLAVVGILAAAVMPASTLLLQSRTGMLAAAWASNFYFAFQHADYFALDPASSLYLHTWSLGVEEQFYLLWPVLLAGVWKHASPSPAEQLQRMLAVIVVLGFLGALWLHARHPVEAYYLMPTRLWELGLGGLVALLVHRAPTPSVLRAEGLRWIGMTLVLGGMLVIRPGQSHLFAWLLLPTVGTAMLLLANSSEQGAALVVIASRPLRWLGRVSYALYLWHWPLLGLGRAAFGDSFLHITLMVVVSVVVAWMSTVLLEEPLRRIRWRREHAHVMGGLAVTLLLVVSHQAWFRFEENAQEARRVAMSAQLRAQFTGPTLYKLGCDRTFKSAELYPCVIVAPEHPLRRVLLLGDSVAAQWTPAVEELGRRHDWYVISLTKAGCPMVDEPIYYVRLGREYFECAKWRDRVADYLRKTRFDVVFISSSARYEFSNAQWIAGTRSFLARTRGAAPQLALLDPTPALPFQPYDCLLGLDGLTDADLVGCSVPIERARNPEVGAALREASRGFPEVRHVSLDALVCPDGRCAVMRGGQLVYRDDVHLHVAFVREIAAGFEAAVLPSSPRAP